MIPIIKNMPLRTMRRHGRLAFLPPSAISPRHLTENAIYAFMDAMRRLMRLPKSRA